jgi:hypothetical protein
MLPNRANSALYFYTETIGREIEEFIHILSPRFKDRTGIMGLSYQKDFGPQALNRLSRCPNQCLKEAY